MIRAFLLGTVGFGALAITTPALADTLREALVSAYETNPNLTAAREGQKATNESVPLAKAAGRPRADASVAYTESFPRSNGAGNNFSPDRIVSISPNVSIPLYAGGGIRNSVRAAENRVEAGFASLRGTESAIFSAVVGAYMDVIRDEAIVELNRAQAGVLQVNLEATRDRFEIGDLTRTDVAQSEARLALQISQLESARANLIRSKEIYIQLVGREPGELESPPPLPNLPVAPDAAVDVAIDNNPDLIAARENREAAGFDRRAANASRLPTVSAVGGSTQSNNFGSIDTPLPYDRWSSSAQIGLRANIPLYQGGEAGARIRQAQARLGQAQELEIATEREVIAQTRAAYASLQASQEVILASERAVAANELSLEGVRAENSVGNRTILDILNAEQELLNSKVQLVTARRNAYVAGFSLLAAMGRAEARDLGLEGGPLYDPLAEYRKVDGAWTDWDGVPDPTIKATRTVDTPAQKAEITPLPKY
ncbi:MAG: TolC family outer membrane protein [Sphingorhabdus sp.]